MENDLKSDNHNNPNIPNNRRKILLGMFLFPLLITVGMAIFLCTAVFLTQENETPETMITAIKTGTPSKRWQKAFELSNELNIKKEAIRSEGLRNELIHILLDAEQYDTKTRSYIAMALAHFNDPESVMALIQILHNPAEDEDVSVAVLDTLGKLHAKDAITDIFLFLSHKSKDLRMVACYVLGSLGQKEAISHLEPLLNDTVAEVQWNAALNLAQLGSNAGENILIKMLDRQSLQNQHQVSDSNTESIMINAIKGLTMIHSTDCLNLLQQIAENDPSLKVRHMAMEATKLLQP